jgi:hypothetical protein
MATVGVKFTSRKMPGWVFHPKRRHLPAGHPRHGSSTTVLRLNSDEGKFAIEDFGSLVIRRHSIQRVLYGPITSKFEEHLQPQPHFDLTIYLRIKITDFSHEVVVNRS